jgi:ATP-dependent Lon protease
MKQELTLFSKLEKVMSFSLDSGYYLDATNLAEIAVEKEATTLLIQLNARKQLNDLSDEMITKINIQYYTDLKDCLVKALFD